MQSIIACRHCSNEGMAEEKINEKKKLVQWRIFKNEYILELHSIEGSLGI